MAKPKHPKQQTKAPKPKKAVVHLLHSSARRMVTATGRAATTVRATLAIDQKLRDAGAFEGRTQALEQLVAKRGTQGTLSVQGKAAAARCSIHGKQGRRLFAGGKRWGAEAPCRCYGGWCG